MRTLHAWWATAPDPGNLGDILTPVLLGRLGYTVEWVRQDVAEFLAIGSIIKFATPRMTVWGSGAMWADDRPDPRARYLAVRGPLTRERVLASGGTCPEVYGDPALLLPRVHNDPVAQTWPIGLVPHYRDFGVLSKHYGGHPSVRIINPLNADPLVPVDEIRSCRSIVSSSLHGLVVAHAYGIPAAWLDSDRLSGDGTKFRDYGLSVGLDWEPCGRVEDAEPVLGTLDTQPLLDALEAL